MSDVKVVIVEYLGLWVFPEDGEFHTYLLSNGETMFSNDFEKIGREVVRLDDNTTWL
jgi:hypothetical protein